ncbi:MAG: hypothetical protein ACRYGB_14075 [Janthinobacterium lividum]
MGKSVVAILLACFFLAGSTLLPLGDFSLMRDIPSMYRSYCQVRAGKPDPVDFIGDYLLGGKDLLGHNSRDAPAKSDSSLQFQHQAVFSLIVLFYSKLPAYLFSEALDKPIMNHLLRLTTDYNNPVFRPPFT